MDTLSITLPAQGLSSLELFGLLSHLHEVLIVAQFLKFSVDLSFREHQMAEQALMCLPR